MIVTCQEMKAIETRAFAAGVEAEALMEEAGSGIARAIEQFFPLPGEALIFYGKGHNGGDALVAARLLAAAGWRIGLRGVYDNEALAELTLKKLRALESGNGLIMKEAARQAPTIILDGLLGIGAQPGLRPPIAAAVQQINHLRRESGAFVFALDLPTGLDGETGATSGDAVEADATLTIGFAKKGLLEDRALDHVGRLVILPLADLEPFAGVPQESGEVSTLQTLSGLCPPRRFGIHKGECGRVAILAGSPGFTGAAAMAAAAAVRGGSGLVTLLAPPSIYPTLASIVMPEVMVTPVESYADFDGSRYDVIAAGPGLGQMSERDGAALLQLVETFPRAMVLDADALNLLSHDLLPLRARLGPRLLTPHPGEMVRLFPSCKELTRKETAQSFVKANNDGPPLTLLLKGSRTLVYSSDGRLTYNSTGHPGMASGGMGDILTGLTAALLAQGLSPFDAARVGAWICGRSAECAVSHGWRSQESLCATDLLEFFGTAFHELRTAKI